MGLQKVQNNIPKRSISKPSIVSLVFFIIIAIIWVPHTLPLLGDMASIQVLVAIFLAPLAIVGLFLAYSSGITLAKYNYDDIVKGNLTPPYLRLALIQFACIGGCLLCEFMMVGYPFKMCFDFCQQMNIVEATIIYFIVSSIMFSPAYCSIQRYYKWVLKYNLPRPTIG